MVNGKGTLRVGEIYKAFGQYTASCWDQINAWLVHPLQSTFLLQGVTCQDRFDLF